MVHNCPKITQPFKQPGKRIKRNKLALRSLSSCLLIAPFSLGDLPIGLAKFQLPFLQNLEAVITDLAQGAGFPTILVSLLFNGIRIFFVAYVAISITRMVAAS